MLSLKNVLQNEPGTLSTLSLTGTSNQIILQSAGVTGTITATPASTAKVWTLQNVTGTVYQTNGDDVAVADGGTGGSSAGITLFNNITGYTASGATGTTSTNLVFSTSPTLVTPALGAASADSLSLGTGELTAGSINRAADTLTLEVGGDAQLSLTTALATIAHDLCVNETIYFDAVQTATGDGGTTIDWGLGNKFVFTFGATNETFTFTAPGGPCNLLLMLIQDGVGSRTATWPSGTPDVKWPSNGTAPTLSTGAADVDIITFFWDGTNYYGQAAPDFA